MTDLVLDLLDPPYRDPQAMRKLLDRTIKVIEAQEEAISAADDAFKYIRQLVENYQNTYISASQAEAERLIKLSRKVTNEPS